MKDFQLNSLAKSAKILVSLFLFEIAANHIFSLLLAYHITHDAFSSTEEYFHYQQDTRKLLRMSHQHSFGHGVMYLIVGGLFCFTKVKEKVKLALIPTPFIGAGLDQTSWWLMKFKGVEWEWISYLGGTLFSVGFCSMAFIVFYELWFRKNLKQNDIVH